MELYGLGIIEKEVGIMELLLTVEQAAERLQLNLVTVRRQLQRGDLRGIRRGRLWRIPETALTEPSPTSTTEVTERLAALEQLVRRGQQWTKSAPPLASDAVSSAYDEREAAQL